MLVYVYIYFLIVNDRKQVKGYMHFDSKGMFLFTKLCLQALKLPYIVMYISVLSNEKHTFILLTWKWIFFHTFGKLHFNKISNVCRNFWWWSRWWMWPRRRSGMWCGRWRYDEIWQIYERFWQLFWKGCQLQPQFFIRKSGDIENLMWAFQIYYF